MNIHTNHNHKYVEHIARGMQESIDPDSVQITLEPVDGENVGSSKWVVHIGTLLRVAIPIEPLENKEDACYKAGVEVGKEFKEYILKWARHEDCNNLQEENAKLKEALKSTLDIIDHEVDLRVLHPGSCGPNSPCDCDCQNKARLSTLIHEYKMLLQEVK